MHKTMKYYLLLFIGFISITLNSQNTKGIITDTEQKPIPYATVSIKNTNKGCFSNETGQFNLEHQLNKEDTLLISCIGYQTAEITAGNINPKQFKVSLQKSNYGIKPVTVFSQKRKLIKVKDNKRVSVSACLSKGSEMVTYIDIRKGSTLNDVTFYCQPTSASRLLAVRVYSMNYKGKPDECIIPENRVVEIGPFRTQFTFDLKDLNIVAEQNGLFVGIQYIYVNKQGSPKRKKQNPYIYFSTLNSEHRTYFRSMAQNRFQKDSFGQAAFTTDKIINLQCSYSYYAP